MKKSVKLLALCIAAVILCMTLASCSTISGTYKSDGLFGIGATELEFKGSKMYVNMSGIEAEAKYSIDGDKITIEFQDADEDKADVSDIFELLNGEHDFEKGDDYIKIDGVKYKKQ